jgi:hypothetical protein
MGTYRFLDLAPWGGNEDGLEEMLFRTLVQIRFGTTLSLSKITSWKKYAD